MFTASARTWVWWMAIVVLFSKHISLRMDPIFTPVRPIKLYRFGMCHRLCASANSKDTLDSWIRCKEHVAAIRHWCPALTIARSKFGIHENAMPHTPWTINIKWRPFASMTRANMWFRAASTMTSKCGMCARMRSSIVWRVMQTPLRAFRCRRMVRTYCRMQWTTRYASGTFALMCPPNDAWKYSADISTISRRICCAVPGRRTVRKFRPARRIVRSTCGTQHRVASCTNCPATTAASTTSISIHVNRSFCPVPAIRPCTWVKLRPEPKQTPPQFHLIL